jgi:hypothetical protein
MQYDKSAIKKGLFIKGGAPRPPSLELDDDVPTLDDIGARIAALKEKIEALRRK